MSEQAVRGDRSCPIAFDQHSVDHARTWTEQFARIRSECPRAWTDSYGGFWIASKLEDIIGIGQRPESFTAHKEIDPVTGETSGGVSIPQVPSLRAVPNETAGEEWKGARTFLDRRFAPRAVETRRDKAKQIAAALIDEVIETGRFDIVDDLTNPLPAIVTMDIFGFPLGEWRDFADPFHKMTYTRRDDPGFLDTIRGLDHFLERVDEEIALRRKEPREDLLGLMASGTINGAPLDRQYCRNMALNILAGGVDTTTALTSNTLIYLSQHPEDRARLIADPALLPVACEEFVRYFSPVHSIGRNASEDVDLNGWQMRKGDRVLLAFASANRDTDAFENPDRLILDRFPNKHVAFGSGQHRCLGSFLARMMWSVMVTEVLARMPDYRVIEDGMVSYPSIASVNGWINIPATFTPGPKVGARIE
jgi:cytochrome P450